MRHQLEKWFGELPYIGNDNGVVSCVSSFSVAVISYWVKFHEKEVLNNSEMGWISTGSQSACLKRRYYTKRDITPLEFGFCHHVASVSFMCAKAARKLFGLSNIVEVFRASLSSVESVDPAFISFRLRQSFLKRVLLSPFYLETLNSHEAIIGGIN